ncbi:hypothetical protein DFP72DRAFT_933789 [Ephemerocybe angulata]|uniref:Uncharacterized protein n=1 Tax=Ephemerocybe angulata TaxID=980116 RepID=A0A8H6HBX2_9AGAR|nr:hypothetical protein DFP72DRAFT_933789 [Tulosesus angulatus]
MLGTSNAPTTPQRNVSPSPPRSGGLGSKISSFGARLTRQFTNEREEGSVTSASPILGKDRSQSRGREALQSTGRGGFGNIRQTSLSRDRPDGPDDFSTTRGREPAPQVHLGGVNAIYSTGRGGAGNLRSPSREPTRVDTREKEVIDSYVAQQGEVPVSTGRGGLGNISTARSRSRDPLNSREPSRSRSRLTTGRGGAGNVREEGVGGVYEGNRADEVERERRGKELAGGHGHEGPHSTGRGGIANITEQEEPALERPSLSGSVGGYGSTGRGGAGNIVRN